MEKEKLIVQYDSVTLNVTGNKIDSYRQNNETKNTIRVYDQGAVGIAGSLGELKEEALTASAVEALNYGIQYPCDLGTAIEENHADHSILSPSEFLPQMQHLLDRLSETCPRFAASNKISLNHFNSVYENSKGSSLKASGDSLSVSLIFQDKGSGNLFDCAYGTNTRFYDEDAIVADCKKLYDAFYTPAEIEEGEYPVFFSPSDILGSMIQHFVAEMYVSGASLLSGRLGQKVANASLTLCEDRNFDTNPGACFFDDEGQVAAGHRPSLIKDGILIHVIASKGTAAMLGLTPSGTSSAPYDGVPGYGLSGIYAEPTAAAVQDLAPGRSVLVVLASGGDMTPDGHYATPAQLAYLVEKGRIIGRLPQINISGNFFEMLGNGYLGAVKNAFLPSSGDTFMAFKMNVTK